MTRKTTLFVIGFLVFFSAIDAKRFPASGKAENLYREANRLFNLENPTEKTDQQALRLFSDVIGLYRIESLPPDTTLFFSHFKTGVIHEVYTAYAEAKNEYIHALALKPKIQGLSDSLCFPVYLYAGVAYYHLNRFDSAEHYLLIAEDVLNNFPALAEKNRLFNSLGALYYESGNYGQSHNYFTRGLELTDPYEKEAIINFRINIGASAIKLGAYEEALRIYEEVAGSGVLTDEIYQNMGKAYKALGRQEEALKYFQRVDPSKVPAVNNEIALAYIRLKQYEQARTYLQRVDPAVHSRINITDVGTRELYAAILEKELKQYARAVNYLQQAIVHFSAANFSDTAISANPRQFTGTFTSYKLFDALVEKGIVLREIYRNTQQVDKLLHSLAAFESAIGLVQYIGQSYDTDDARMFIKNNTQNAFQGAFSACLELAKLFPDKHYFEKAFLISEKNKASVLTGGVRENRLKKESGIDESLLKEEQQVKLEIAKLNLQAESILADSGITRIANAKRDQEIRLSQLQKAFEKNEVYRNVKYEAEYSGTEALKKMISPEEVIISYAVYDSGLHAFVLDRQRFEHLELGDIQSINSLVEELTTDLKQVESGYRYKGSARVVSLYNRLILPLLPFMNDKKELIIIPDGILYFLPFEILQSEESEQPLLYSKTISYHFSTRLISRATPGGEAPIRVLAVAPFAAGKHIGKESTLPASAEEVEALPGKILMNAAAEKERFLDSANHYPVVHLATHAVARVSNPSASYIAFYPSGADGGSRLYLDELYGLQLESVKLVIMSACETGEGKLVEGEGVLSLSRGFAYAGAQSIVTSLWKAEDHSTAFIVKKFHEYLREGRKKSVALQQAKIDYLRSGALHTTPNYWAHLVLIGDPSPLAPVQSARWAWLVVGGVLIVVILYLIRGKSRTEK